MHTTTSITTRVCVLVAEKANGNLCFLCFIHPWIKFSVGTTILHTSLDRTRYQEKGSPRFLLLLAWGIQQYSTPPWSPRVSERLAWPDELPIIIG